VKRRGAVELAWATTVAATSRARSETLSLIRCIDASLASRRERAEATDGALSLIVVAGILRGKKYGFVVLDRRERVVEVMEQSPPLLILQ
jgi:hypothetical protein